MYQFISKCNCPYSPESLLFVISTCVIHDAWASSTFHQGWYSPVPVTELDESSINSPSTALLAKSVPYVLLWLAGRPRAKFICATTQKRNNKCNKAHVWLLWYLLFHIPEYLQFVLRTYQGTIIDKLENGSNSRWSPDPTMQIAIYREFIAKFYNPDLYS